MSNRSVLMKASPAKEEPNTPNIIVWPQGYQESNVNSKSEFLWVACFGGF
eukprot:gene23221-30098_t